MTLGKAILSLLAAGFLISCSSPGNGGASGLLFDSHLKVDEAAFVPTKYTGENPQWHVLTTTEGDGALPRRTFILESVHDSLEFSEEIRLSVHYPASQASAGGTYAFAPGAATAEGFYRSDTAYFDFLSGMVAISDLGNNNYRLEFSGVSAQTLTMDR